MRARPVTPDGLVALVAARIDELADKHDRVRLAVDGAPGSDPAALADALVDPLRVAGHAVVRASAWDFLRPASLRLEQGREDPDAFYDDWLDVGGLDRELLTPLGPGGSGRYLPTLWNMRTDRATRAPYAQAPPRSVLVLDGTLLLGRWLQFELTVHLSLSAAALRRRIGADELWTLPAYERYAEDAAPLLTADVAVRMDDPRHPAVVEEA